MLGLCGVCVFDAEDYEKIKDYRWRSAGTEGKYIYSTYGVLFHRLIVTAKTVDHRNGNTFDNRKLNLRNCTQQQNTMNRKGNAHHTSEFKGVSWDSKQEHWVAQIKKNHNKNMVIGTFNDEVLAAKAYDTQARKLFGEYAYLNFGG